MRKTQFPHLPAALHRSTALIHHVLFWKHQPHCNTAEELKGGKKRKKKEMAHYTDDRAWVKEDIWASVVYLSEDSCLNGRFGEVRKIRTSRSKANEQRHRGFHEGFKLWPSIKKPCGRFLKWKAVRIWHRRGPTASQSGAERATGWNTNAKICASPDFRGIWTPSVGSGMARGHGVRPEERRPRQRKIPGVRNVFFFIIQHVQLIMEAPGSEKYQRDPTLCCTFSSKKKKKGRTPQKKWCRIFYLALCLQPLTTSARI